MPSCLSAICCLLLTAHTGAYTRNEVLSPIRILDPLLLGLFTAGLDRSPTLRALVTELTTSNLIVHVVPCLSHCRYAGALRFTGSAGGHRFVRISIDVRLHPGVQLPILAHELQHAVELARAPHVSTRGEFLTLFDSIGFRTTPTQLHFETRAAQHVTNQVRQEVRDYLAAQRRAEQ